MHRAWTTALMTWSDERGRDSPRRRVGYDGENCSQQVMAVLVEASWRSDALLANCQAREHQRELQKFRSS